MVLLQYFILLVGFIVLFLFVSKITKEKKGDEREKSIVQLAGFSAWGTMVGVFGLRLLLVITHINIPILLIQKENFETNFVNSLSVFSMLIIFYAISYAYHWVRKSSFNGK